MLFGGSISRLAENVANFFNNTYKRIQFTLETKTNNKLNLRIFTENLLKLTILQHYTILIILVLKQFYFFISFFELCTNIVYRLKRIQLSK